jgi:hypothetical protein
MSNIINKVKEAVTHDKHEKPSHSTNAGPHDSNMANKVDPRVDSDRGMSYCISQASLPNADWTQTDVLPMAPLVLQVPLE